MTLIDDIKTWVDDQIKQYPYLSWEDVTEYFNGEIVQDNVVGTGRWDTQYETVTRFSVDDEEVFVQFFRTEGSTEYQESDPLDEQLTGNLTFVKPVEVTTIKYVK